MAASHTGKPFFSSPVSIDEPWLTSSNNELQFQIDTTNNIAAGHTRQVVRQHGDAIILRGSGRYRGF